MSEPVSEPQSEHQRDDVIALTGIEGYGYHGVLPEEREAGQPFVVDVVITLDVSAAAAHDDLARTLDYSLVARAAVDVIEGEPRQLIETVADEIAQRVLAHEVAKGVRVTVHKPQAPVGVPFADVSVTVVRRR